MLYADESHCHHFFSQGFFLVGMCITKTSCNMGMLLDTSNTFSVPSCVLLYFESRSNGFECPPWVLNFVSGCILLPVSSTWIQCLLRSLSSCDLDWMEHYQEQLHLKWDAGSRWMFYFNFFIHPTPILREMIQFDHYVFKTGFSTESSEHWKICIPTTSAILSNWSMLMANILGVSQALRSCVSWMPSQNVDVLEFVVREWPGS